MPLTPAAAAAGGGEQQQQQPSVLETNPHLAHYIFKLVLSNAQLSAAAARSTSGGQHPLSVSSSGESDDDESDNENGDDDARDSESVSVPTIEADGSSTDDGDSSTGSAGKGPSNGHTRRPPPLPLGPSREEREELTRKIIELLDNDQEEDVKEVLRAHMGELGKVSPIAWET